jgi:hypothetical protein
LFPFSTKTPALTGFQKTLRLSAFSAPRRLSSLFPHAPGEAFSGVPEVRPKLLFESGRKPNTYLGVETP